MDSTMDVRVCSTRQQGNSTTSQGRRQTSWTLARAGKVIRSGHPQGGGIKGCSSGVIWETSILGLELSECRRTHTHTLLKYPLGKPLEAKLPKQMYPLGGTTAFTVTIFPRTSSVATGMRGARWVSARRGEAHFVVYMYSCTDPAQLITAG